MKKKNRQTDFFWLKICLTFVILAFFGFFLTKWYLSRDELVLQTPVVAEVLENEVKYSEFYNYVLENDHSVIYLTSSKDKTCRAFEKEIKSFFVSHSFEDAIVYMNLYEMEISHFFSEFSNHFDYQGEMLSVPAFVYFEEGKVKAMLSGELTKEKTEDFFREIGLIL